MKKYFVVFLSIGFLVSSCSKSDDDVSTPDNGSNSENSVEKLVADYPVQNFMWQAMNAYYFWQADVADLADSKDDIAADYAEFLSSESDPANFFFKICNQHRNVVGDEAAVDRFSFLSENYQNLIQGFEGVSKSDGVEFGLSLYDTDKVFGYVRYIVPGSDAASKEISRGDIFIGINGTELTLDNYRNLLFGDISTYEMNFATIENRTIIPNGKSLSLTKEEGLSENPILINKVIERNGLKIGYLMYNSFIANYDEQLNDAFGELKAANIDELILDFRYNGGGRVSSAIQIASSIYGAKTNELFLKARFNNKIQSTFSPGDDESNFIDRTIDGSPINELNLNRVYVITTNGTASASELVINGLEPYVDVILVGEKTRGKNEFSVTFVDDRANNYFYNEDREANINPNNQWAIQPLLGRNENADGFLDYTSGLNPDHELEEDLANLGTLGEPTEPLLARTLDVITGTTSKFNLEPIFFSEVLSSSAEMKATHDKMLMDGLINATTFKNKE